MDRRIPSILRSAWNNTVLNHSAHTTVAALASFGVARLCGLPEISWAVVTTLVVMQSSLGTSLPVAWRRFTGTVLGAAMGALLGANWQPGVWSFGVGLFFLGLICAILGHMHKQLEDKLDRSAYRFAGITLAIILLIPPSGPIWIVALHRFLEVSIGIAVAVVMTVLWPGRARDGASNATWWAAQRGRPNFAAKPRHCRTLQP